MIEYVETDKVCRSKMLLSYFDESNSKNCGICDVCLQKNKKGLTNTQYKEIKELLLQRFSEAFHLRLNELVNSITEYVDDPDKVIEVIRLMVQERVFLLENDTLSLRKRKQ